MYTYCEFLTTSIKIVVLEIFNKSWFFLFPVLYEQIKHIFKNFFIKLAFHKTNSLVYLKLVGLGDFRSNVVSPRSKFNIMHLHNMLCFTYGIYIHVHYTPTHIHMHTSRGVLRGGHLPSLT